MTFVGCRAGEEHNGYAFRVQPAPATFHSGDSMLMARSSWSAAMLPLSSTLPMRSNRIEIACSGDSISGALNGEAAISTSDNTVASGLFIGAVATAPETPGTLFASFDNLEVSALSSSAEEEESVEATPGEEETAGTPEAAEEEAATAEALRKKQPQPRLLRKKIPLPRSIQWPSKQQ